MSGGKKTSLLEMAIRCQQQNETHYITMEDAEMLAETFQLSLWEVLDALTFYDEICFEPKGKHVIKICKSPCCYLEGGKQIYAVLKNLLGIGPGETTEDGVFTLEEIGCIGACDRAPAALIDGHLYAELDERKLIALLEHLSRGTETR